MRYCGACGDEFDSCQSLSDHLGSCPAVAALMPMVLRVWFAAQPPGHDLSVLVVRIHRSAHLIKRYARIVASGLNSLDRAQAHYDLCESLGIPRTEFMPFEKDGIDSIPTEQEALGIIWDCLRSISMNLPIKWGRP